MKNWFWKDLIEHENALSTNIMIFNIRLDRHHISDYSYKGCCRLHLSRNFFLKFVSATGDILIGHNYGDGAAPDQTMPYAQSDLRASPSAITSMKPQFKDLLI